VSHEATWAGILKVLESFKCTIDAQPQENFISVAMHKDDGELTAELTISLYSNFSDVQVEVARVTGQRTQCLQLQQALEATCGENRGTLKPVTSKYAFRAPPAFALPSFQDSSCFAKSTNISSLLTFASVQNSKEQRQAFGDLAIALKREALDLSPYRVQLVALFVATLRLAHDEQLLHSLASCVTALVDKSNSTERAEIAQALEPELMCLPDPSFTGRLREQVNQRLRSSLELHEQHSASLLIC